MGKNAILGLMGRADAVDTAGWDDVADDGWENSQSGPEWEDAAEPMDDPKD